jgi:hypothetical protein
MLAWDQIYDLEVGTADVGAKLQAGRKMMRAKYVFGCGGKGIANKLVKENNKMARTISLMR